MSDPSAPHSSGAIQLEHVQSASSAKFQALTEKPVEDFQDIKDLANQGREALLTSGLSRSLSHAIRRGETLTERKSAWMFDFYQGTGFYPVDYSIYSRPFRTQCGVTELISVHPQAYTADGEVFSADNVYQKESMRDAHKKAVMEFQNLQEIHATTADSAGVAAVARAIPQKQDDWARIKHRVSETLSAQH